MKVAPLRVVDATAAGAEPTSRPLTTVGDLVGAGLVAPAEAADLSRVIEDFALRITPEMAALIDPAGQGPVARQFLPDAAELEIAPGEMADPTGDGVHEVLPGLVHRYADRVLLKPLQVCAVYCRFCFRREAVGPGEGLLGAADLAAAVDYVRARPGIFEVVLSGGDPLVLSDRRLAALLDALDAVPHLGVVRIHTRVPVVDPGRVTDDLLRLLDRRVAVWLVLHVNTAEELTDSALDSIRRLSRAGIPLLAQTVLLAGVNDTPHALEGLFRRLVANRVKPYYLHHLDPARGTGHFRTSIAEGQALMRDLRGRVSGLCQPTYVLDIPGGHGKVPIGPGYLESRQDGTYTVRDPQGREHAFRDAAAGQGE
ncbi:lysine-2,3-aminomutase-like protein [Prosthecomicrobium sp. N25]|uniref:lysine-2,3-aminomutase-like protein n=1 Tax=Prosthecomicrobium sp. N25 TaxID=3129254 RepID=UPI0030771E89